MLEMLRRAKVDGKGGTAAEQAPGPEHCEA